MLLLSLLWACGGGAGAGGIADSAGPTSDTGVAGVDCTDDWQSWQNTGQPLMLTWCTACHGSAVTGDRRKGAPEGVDLDTLAGVRAHADRVDVRLSLGDMPPAGGMPGDDVARLRAWLACGAQGEERPLPDFGPLDEDSAAALEMLAETEVDPDDPALLRLRRHADGSAPDAAWRTERYLLTDSEAWLIDAVDQDDDGAVVSGIDFGAGLPLLPAGDAWEGSVEVTRWTAEGEATATETWAVQLGPTSGADTMELDLDAVEVIALSSAGDELGWHLSPDRGVVAAWVDGDAGRSWAALQIEAVLVSFPADPPAFPLDPDWDFVERLIVEGTP